MGEDMAKGKQVKVLQQELDIVRREIDKLRAQESMLEKLIRMDSGEPRVKPRAPRSNVKQAVLSLLERHPAGLNAAMAVEIAKEAGIQLERGSVSSLLSRMKNEDVVTYDGSVYRLATQRRVMPGIVQPIRTSGAGM
jgi:hypothetical protein